MGRGRGSSAPPFSVCWSTQQLHKCPSPRPGRSTLIPDFVSPREISPLCSQLRAGAHLSPGWISAQAKGREGRGVGIAPVRAEPCQCHLPAVPGTKHGHSWQSLEQRGCSQRERSSPQNSNAWAIATAECGAVRSINWHFSSAQNRSWPSPRSFAQSCIVSEQHQALLPSPLPLSQVQRRNKQ